MVAANWKSLLLFALRQKQSFGACIKNGYNLTEIYRCLLINGQTCCDGKKRTRLFLRTTEFLWQEGHTAHETEKEARDEALHILELYKTFAEEYMALPVITGTKSEQEKFAGAVETLAVEALMQDKKSLQVGTSHFLGQNFAKAFNVQFQNRKGILEHVWATSWGVSTRLIGAIIMCHSDDNGLVLPPKLAPTEIVIIPIFKDSNKTTILQAANNMFQQLKKDFRVKIDNDENNSPGWKFAEWELRGIPLRIEIGARDLENGQVTIARRDTREKKEVKLAYVQEECSNLLGEIQKNLYNTAKNFRDEHSHTVLSYNEMKEFFTSHNNGFIHMPWDGTQETETKIKQETMATIRVLPFNGHEHVKGKHDPVSGKPAKQLAVFAKAY